MSSVSGLSEPTTFHAHRKAHSLLRMGGPRSHLHASAQAQNLICVFVNRLCKGSSPIKSDVSDPICSHPSSADRRQSIARAFVSLGSLGDTPWQGLAFEKCLCAETQSCMPVGTGTLGHRLQIQPAHCTPKFRALASHLLRCCCHFLLSNVGLLKDHFYLFFGHF